VLRDVTSVDMTCSLLGTALPWPIAIAPTSRHDVCDAEGEVATARGAAASGALFVVSTGSERTLDEIAGAAARAPRWFQVYMARDRAWTRDRVQEAAELGCSAVLLTVDVPVVSRRRSTGGGLAEKGRVQIELDPSVGLDAIAWLRSVSGLPVVVKGVLRADDAERCVAAGAAGVIVSNHGGRQLDGAIATARALPEVVAAVGQVAEVYVDGGVRRGTDVLKALARGARSVFVGRPVLWGLAAGGAEGVAAVLRGLADELELAMQLVGCAALADVDAELVRVG
jgi:4-hydroxymandelate oxidase